MMQKKKAEREMGDEKIPFSVLLRGALLCSQNGERRDVNGKQEGKNMHFKFLLLELGIEICCAAACFFSYISAARLHVMPCSTLHQVDFNFTARTSCINTSIPAAHEFFMQI